LIFSLVCQKRSEILLPSEIGLLFVTDIKEPVLHFCKQMLYISN